MDRKASAIGSLAHSSSQHTSLPPGAAPAHPETKSQDVQQAVDCYQKGMELAHHATTYEEHVQSIEQFSLAIAIRNNQPRFFFARGNAFRSINAYDFAAKDYTAAIALDDRSALYYANRGACYRKLMQTIAALEDLTHAIEIDSKKANHYYNRALVLYEARFYKEAIIDFSKALEEGAATGGIGSRAEFRVFQNRGNCYRKLGNLTKCIDDLQRALQIDSRNASGFAFLAQAYLECQDYENAIEQYTNAITLSATNALHFSQRGLCYYRKGAEFARASLADFNKCIQLDGKDPQAYFYRGSIRLGLALEQSMAQTASTSTAAAATPSQAAPASSMQYFASAANGGLSLSTSLGFLTTEQQLEAAFEDIEMAWTLSPGECKYHVGMAMITQLRKDFAAAGKLFEEIHAVDKDSLIVRYHLALCLHVTGDHERALTLLTDVIDVLPQEPLFFEARGLLLQELQLHDMAIEDFAQAIALREDEPSARNFYLRGESLLRLDRFQEVVDDCSAALNGDLAAQLNASERTSGLNARGMAFRGLGDYDQAVQDLSSCLDLAPANDIFRFHRGLCLMECARYADALPDLHAAANANRRDLRILYFVGMCYYHEGAYPECIAHLSAALKDDPPVNILPDLHYHMGLSYAHRQQNIAAIEQFTFALQRSENAADSDSSDTLTTSQALYVHERAKALQLERYYEEARADFTRVLQQNPHNAHAYFRRGFCFKALGQLREAAADLETAKLLDPTNLQLVVNYKELKDTDCVILCAPGYEKVY